MTPSVSPHRPSCSRLSLSGTAVVTANPLSALRALVLTAVLLAPAALAQTGASIPFYASETLTIPRLDVDEYGPLHVELELMDESQLLFRLHKAVTASPLFTPAASFDPMNNSLSIPVTRVEDRFYALEFGFQDAETARLVTATEIELPGQSDYSTSCAGCHGVTGAGGAQAPPLADCFHCTGLTALASFIEEDAHLLDLACDSSCAQDIADYILRVFSDRNRDWTGPLPEPAAFAGCEGWGCETEGGRGGQLYIVTSTDDSGPGSLREALEAEGPRFIVTQTDGVIALQTPIIVRHGAVTLDLRRPPGSGLTVHGKAITFQDIDNVIVLGLRYRGTDSIAQHGADAGSVDCVGFNSVNLAVVARSSFFGCVDEAVSIERSSSPDRINSHLTVQNNLFLEGCMLDCQGGQGHARPINLSRGWDRVSIHHNAFFGNERRQPQIAGCVEHPDCSGTAWPQNPVAYMGYNLVGYWLEQATQVRNGAWADIVGNVYVPGAEAVGRPIEVLDESDLSTRVHVASNFQCATGVLSCVEAESRLEHAETSTLPLSGMSVTASREFELLSDIWIRQLGPDAWDEEDERVLQQFLSASVSVGGGYPPASYDPPLPLAGSVEDGDGDGLPDEVDPLPAVFSAWHDTNQDGWRDLEAYLNRLDID